MRTAAYLFLTSILIATSVMAAPAKVQPKEKCTVQTIGSISDMGSDGSPVDIVSLKCQQKSVSALVFSQAQSMIFSMAKKNSKPIAVSFEKIDKKRLAVTEIDYK